MSELNLSELSMALESCVKNKENSFDDKLSLVEGLIHDKLPGEILGLSENADESLLDIYELVGFIATEVRTKIQTLEEEQWMEEILKTVQKEVLIGVEDLLGISVDFTKNPTTIQIEQGLAEIDSAVYHTAFEEDNLLL